MTKLRPDNFKIDLQLFAEKTEKPTPKRRQKAAEEGQIPRSAEINSVVVLLAVFVAIKVYASSMIHVWATMTGNIYKFFSRPNFELDYVTVQEMFLLVLISTSKMLTPIVVAAMVGGLAASYFQVGFRFNLSKIKFDLKNIDPIAGLKRMFSAQALAELIKSIFKVLIVGYVSYSEFMKEFMNFTRLTDMNLRTSSAFIGQVSLNVVFKVIIWLVILAVADLIFQRWNNERKLKMSKKDVKDEFKRQEGDPQVKGQIKQKQRQMSMNRMMQVLPRADVVITNPTHFAVALKYDSGTMNAPVVLAKGQDRIALKIKEVAREHNIVLVENKPLAQSLFHSTEIGDAIPDDLFQAVAEVLAFVYKLKGKI